MRVSHQQHRVFLVPDGLESRHVVRDNFDVIEAFEFCDEILVELEGLGELVGEDEPAVVVLADLGSQVGDGENILEARKDHFLSLNHIVVNLIILLYLLPFKHFDLSFFSTFAP